MGNDISPAVPLRHAVSYQTPRAGTMVTIDTIKRAERLSSKQSLMQVLWPWICLPSAPLITELGMLRYIGWVLSMQPLSITFNGEGRTPPVVEIKPNP